jgi:phosphatidylglycerol:prolipoprotein diacylglycerol transferase
LARHPSQLYEALLEGPLLLIVLWLIWQRRKPRPGGTAFLFLMLYGVFRFAVEFTREPDPQLGFIAWGWLTMGQLLSVGLIIAASAAWVFVLPPGSDSPTQIDNRSTVPLASAADPAASPRIARFQRNSAAN